MFKIIHIYQISCVITFSEGQFLISLHDNQRKQNLPHSLPQASVQL